MTAAVTKQELEIEISRRFLNVCVPMASAPRSLSDFSANKSLGYSRQQLDNMMPDVVVDLDGRTVGLELTAYSDSNVKNAWGRFLHEVRSAARRVIATRPEFNGHLIGYTPDTRLPPPAKKVDQFVEQLLDAADSLRGEAKVVDGSIWRYRIPTSFDSNRPYAHWGLVDKYVFAIDAQASVRLTDSPGEVSDGFASSFGTDYEELTTAIEKKANKKRKQCFKEGIEDFWLLIHATREPLSSMVTPLQDREIARLLQSTAAQTASSSGFQKVYVWDYIHGGYVDLVSREYAACRL